jgi:hypothetical protein
VVHQRHRRFFGDAIGDVQGAAVTPSIHDHFTRRVRTFRQSVRFAHNRETLPGRRPDFSAR